MNVVHMRAGKYSIPVIITLEKGRFYFQFPFNKNLMDEIKNMYGRRYHGYDEVNPRKIWSVPDCSRNRFQIAYLCGHNPYGRYDGELLDVEPKRDCLYSHQKNMFRHMITRKQCLISGEMGTGKTLSAIEALEYYDYTSYIWVGTSSALAAAKLEFRKWKTKIQPLFLTYSGFRIAMQKNELYIPRGIVFDEAQKLKTHTAQQSIEAYNMAERMRKEFGDDALIFLMSGAPAPKAPTDWWFLCEIACPGFLKEGDWFKFRNRLAMLDEATSASGQTYQKIKTWWDDKGKCAECGFTRDKHDPLAGHAFKESVNEVEFLYKRMIGLNVVHMKKDCLELPEIQYRVLRIKPTDFTKKAEALILKTVPRTVTALMKCRELSDGFQYKETETEEKEICPRCNGLGRVLEFYDPEYPDEWYPSQKALESGRCKQRFEQCYICDGKKEISRFQRTAIEVPCAKDQVLLNLLSDHEDIGRFVVYAGFQASVDRCVRVCTNEGWDVIRADGRGWLCGELISKEAMLEKFQSGEGNKTVFIGQAGAAGTGLTLTASPSILFYSNSFNADDRIQAINRIHRIGMDVNRGATVFDIVHLDVDQYILNNLNKKFNLLKMSMGQLRDAVAKLEREQDYYLEANNGDY